MMLGHTQYRLDHNKPLGINPIGYLIKNFTKKCGIDDWKAIMNHNLRATGVTRIANDPNVNSVEVKNDACHKIITTQGSYIHPNHLSE